MFLLRWLSYLPLPVLYLISDFIFFIGYYVVRYRRGIVRKNIQSCFPEKSETEIRKIERGFYSRLADFLVESIKAITISPSELKKRVIFKNPEFFIESHNSGHNVLVCACHQFNWELAMLCGALSLQTTIDPIYMKLTNHSFNELIYGIRSRFGGQPIEMSESGLKYARAIKSGHAIANVGDQIPPKTGADVLWIPFFGIDTAWFTGQEQLSKMFKMTPLFLWVENPKRGFYEIEFIPLADPRKPYKQGEVTRNYVEKLEQMIRRTPTDWLWSHKRWKHNRADFQ